MPLTRTLADLAAHAGEVVAGGRLVVLTGRSGSGRTAILDRVAERHDGRALIGGGIAGLRHVPNVALSRALRLPVPEGDAARAAEFVVAAAGRGTLLVLDDVDLCDSTTLEVVALLAGQLPVIVAVADDTTAGAELAGLLCRVRQVTRLGIGPLPDDEALALALSVIGEAPGGAAATIVRRAEGNPGAILAFARDPGAFDLRTAVANRLAQLPAAERALLCLCGVLGRPVELAFVHEDLAVAARRSAVVEVRNGRIEARSRLDVEVAVAVLSPADRAGLHARLAPRLPDLAEQARHFQAAGDLEAAARAASAAAAVAISPLEAVRLRAIVAQAMSRDERPEQCLRLAVEASDLGDHALAADLVRVAGVADGRAALVCARGALAAGDPARADALLAEVTTAEDEKLAMLVELERARAWCLLDPAEAMAVANDLCRDATTAAARARAVGLLGAAQLALDDDGWEASLEQAEGDARAAGLDDVAYAAAANRVSGLLRHRRPEDAVAVATDNAHRAETARATAWSQRFAAFAFWVTVHPRGALGQARRDGELLLDRALTPSLRLDVVASLALAHADADDLGTAQVLLERAGGAGHDLLDWCRAEVDVLAGDAPGARAAAADLATRATRWPVPAFAAVTAAWAGAMAEPGGAKAFVDGATCEVAALTAGGADQAMAEALFDEAAERWEGLSRRSVLRCQLAAANALAATDTEGALRRLRSLGHDLDGDEWVLVDREVRQTRRRLRDPEVPAANAGPRRTGLSRREAEVMAGVADGLTSTRIAGRLGVAPSTVETHVKSAMRKLGAATRTEAAVMAMT